MAHQTAASQLVLLYIHTWNCTLAAPEPGGIFNPSLPGMVPEELLLPALHLLRARPLPVQLRIHTLQVKSANVDRRW